MDFIWGLEFPLTLGGMKVVSLRFGDSLPSGRYEGPSFSILNFVARQGHVDMSLCIEGHGSSIYATPVGHLCASVRVTIMSTGLVHFRHDLSMGVAFLSCCIPCFPQKAQSSLL